MTRLMKFVVLAALTILMAMVATSCSKMDKITGPDTSVSMSSVAEKLAIGPVDQQAQLSYYLLTDDQRSELLGNLRRQMTDTQIKARQDIYALVGHLFSDTLSVEDATAADQKFRETHPAAVNEYIAVGGLPQYSQRDSRWGANKLGYSSTSTIAQYGCYLTCISDLMTFWGYGGTTPAVLNTWSNFGQSHYAFSPGTDLINTTQAVSYPNMSRPWSTIGAGSYETVRRQLRGGHPVVVHTNWGGSHFMVVYCWDGNQFWVDDPYPLPGGALHPLNGYGAILEFRLLGYNPV